MKFANATNLDRKSGGAEGRDLQFHLRVQQMCHGRITWNFNWAALNHPDGALMNLRVFR